MSKKMQKTEPILDPKITRLETTVAELQAKLARALADYANLERRYSEQSYAIVKFAKSDLLSRLLDVRDHLGLVSDQIKDPSITMILSSFDKLLTDEGVTQIKTEDLYDATTMECQELVPGPKDQVIKVIRPGYLLHERVLRVARVAVGMGDN